MWSVLNMGRAMPCLCANFLGPLRPQLLVPYQPKPTFMRPCAGLIPYFCIEILADLGNPVHIDISSFIKESFPYQNGDLPFF